MEQYLFEEIKRALIDVAHWLWSYTFGLVDPFWSVVAVAVVIVAACYLVAKFFDVLKPVAGAVAIAAITYAVGFWKGENARKTRKK